MEIKIIPEIYKGEFDKFVSHPLQSWAWGDFRKKDGVEVLRLGKFDHNKLAEAVNITFHSIPYTSFKIAYIPKSYWPSEDLLNGIYSEAKKRNCIFVKLEPNILKEEYLILNTKYLILPSSHPLFTKYTFQLDLTKSEEDLLKGMHPKTRYNIKVAQKHNVIITEKNDDTSFEDYLNLMFDTAKRQGFFAHTKSYHRILWKTLRDAGIAHLITAEYKENNTIYTLASWMLFIFNNTLYYPYGASSNEFRNVMASNLIMWETIRFGKKLGAIKFDMWGSLGSDADPKDPWYGFHKFKQGYGAKLVEFAGSYDLVIHPILYRLYSILYTFRKEFLNLKRKLV